VQLPEERKISLNLTSGRLLKYQTSAFMGHILFFTYLFLHAIFTSLRFQQLFY